MWTAVAAIVGLASAFFAWWISPAQVKVRSEKELEKVRRKIREVTNESDKALAKHDSDAVTQCDAMLDELRDREADLLQRISASPR